MVTSCSNFHHLLHRDYQINDQECMWNLKNEEINNEEYIGNYTFITIRDNKKQYVTSNVIDNLKLKPEPYLVE